MRTYRPRRQSSRWLDGDCPAGVLAIYDNGGVSKRNGSVDRFTVFYAETATDHRGDVWISYRGMSEDPSSLQGFGMGGDMPAYKVRAYRYQVRHQAARWSELPEAVRAGRKPIRESLPIWLDVATQVDIDSSHSRNEEGTDMNARAGKATGVVKDWERPGRGCRCCLDVPKRLSRRIARRMARQALREDRWS